MQRFRTFVESADLGAEHEILGMYRDGHRFPIRQISELTGVSVAGIYRILEKYGIKPHRRQRDNEHNVIKQYHTSGFSPNRISELTGYSKRQVYNIINGKHEFREWLEATFDSQGFWTGREGQGASGILAIANDTSNICLSLRSELTHSRVGGKTVQVRCWGTIGGAVKGSDPLASAKQEVKEESGFTGPYLEVEPAYVFRSGSFVYRNYIAIVPEEFAYSPESDSHWETIDLAWVKYEDIIGRNSYNGYPMHDGLVDLLSNSKNLIEKMVEKVRVNSNSPLTFRIRRPSDNQS